MHAERLGLAALLWSLIACGLFLVRRRSPLHLPTLALVTTGLVGSFFPVVSLYIEPSSWRNLDYLSPELVAATQLEYLAFAAGLVIAIAVATRTARRDASAPLVDGTSERDFTVSAALIAVGFTLYALYVRQVGLSARRGMRTRRRSLRTAARARCPRRPSRQPRSCRRGVASRSHLARVAKA